MLGKSHRAVTEAVLTGACLATNQPASATLLLGIGAYFGATAPDIDQKLRHVTHRTWTHTIWAAAIIVILAMAIPVKYVYLQQVTPTSTVPGLRIVLIGFAYGYVTHIVEDSFSRQGVIWSYPLTKYSYYYHKPYIRGRQKHFWMYRTGGKEEWWIRLVARIVLVGEIAYYIYILK